jgi:hypothetical protein
MSVGRGVKNVIAKRQTKRRIFPTPVFFRTTKATAQTAVAKRTFNINGVAPFTPKA